MSPRRQTATLVLVGRCLVVYLIVATAFHWFVEPIKGNSFAAPAEMARPAAADPQPIMEPDRLKAYSLRPALELPSSTGLQAAGVASAVQDTPEAPAVSRPARKAHRHQRASTRLAHEQPAQHVAPPGFGWGLFSGR
jgi:hypothetical protein